MSAPLTLFLVTLPGLEATLAAEAKALGFAPATPVPGGVELTGDWHTVWRANLMLRGATRVLVRLGGFRAMHLAQLDKRARKFDWAATLRPDVPVRVETTCRKSRIYHAGAATQRVETALREALGVEITKDAPIALKVRIEDDFCSFSLDSSGAPLHKRGYKLAVGKAPIRESMAALFLRQCGYDGNEPVLDPMCGSGTFVLEAAEIATGRAPGRERAFAFEHFASFDAQTWQDMRAGVTPRETELRFFGSDRDAGAVRMSSENAERAGIAALTQFTRSPVEALTRPEGPPGLVMVNPPYGARIGNKKLLFAIHDQLGRRLKEQFSGWRVGIVTSEAGLARATGLPLLPPGPPIPHGGLKVKLFQTKALP